MKFRSFYSNVFYSAKMASRFQNVTCYADVGAIKSAGGNFSLLLAIYNLHNLQFMLQKRVNTKS